MVALPSIFHRATTTERAPAANEILMVLQEVDFFPLSKTPNCLCLNSDYKGGPYGEYYVKRLSQIECVLNTSALLL